jgi:spore germination protein GerM
MFLLLIFSAFAVIAFGQNSRQMTIKVFYINVKDDPNVEKCNDVKPVTRKITKTAGVAKAALEELFKGITPEEEAKGFTSFEPTETAGILKGINIKNGSAYVNFDKRVYDQLGAATTSCGGAIFFSGVEKTLKQFPTIKRVFYAIEGNTDDFYDWVQVGECPHGKKHCDKRNFN